MVVKLSTCNDQGLSLQHIDTYSQAYTSADISSEHVSSSPIVVAGGFLLFFLELGE